MMKEMLNVPIINIRLFGEGYVGRFGYYVEAKNISERDCFLYAVSARSENGSFPCWEEVRDGEDKLIRKSGKNFHEAKKAEEAGSACWDYAMKTLASKLGEHIRGEKVV